MANNLQFEKILMKLKTIGNEIKGLDSLEFEEKCNRDLESSFELKIMQSLFIIVQTNPMVSGNTTEDDLNRNPLQSEKEEHRWIRCANCWENVSVDTLRESFIALTPGTINDETTEFLESLSVGFENMQYTDDLARNELIKCQKWIAEVISWQKANKQLTPVKENLKKSMKSMESWRSIQKRFNIRFLD
ncbi:hypothetical protein HK099_003356 [Clydaea vesicula]|uniref:Uncharacterized protein n=1 Tax=Clydaea vesicula TaxID=447962 RepID=A0AAD5XWD4_9FUNG|nr:hypothetical protein HK099_003356 [Clydaea vesicula]